MPRRLRLSLALLATGAGLLATARLAPAASRSPAVFRAFDRAANKELASPAAQFITDSRGIDIVGAAAVNAGLATHVSGVHAKAPYKHVIRLVKPDWSFISKLTMPFFQATSSKLPLTRRVDPRSLVYQGIYQDWSIPALALK